MALTVKDALALVSSSVSIPRAGVRAIRFSPKPLNRLEKLCPLRDAHCVRPSVINVPSRRKSITAMIMCAIRLRLALTALLMAKASCLTLPDHSTGSAVPIGKIFEEL